MYEGTGLISNLEAFSTNYLGMEVAIIIYEFKMNGGSKNDSWSLEGN